jgi:hypothetical protein
LFISLSHKTLESTSAASLKFDSMGAWEVGTFGIINCVQVIITAVIKAARMVMDEEGLRLRSNISDDLSNDCRKLESSNYLVQPLRRQVVFLLVFNPGRAKSYIAFPIIKRHLF